MSPPDQAIETRSNRPYQSSKNIVFLLHFRQCAHRNENHQDVALYCYKCI
jgi:hypothetical protein